MQQHALAQAQKQAQAHAQKHPHTHTHASTTKVSMSSATSTPRWHDVQHEQPQELIITSTPDIITSTPDIKHDDVDVDEPTLPRCTRTCACGHACAGVSGEQQNECFCLQEACVAGQKRM